jgi:PhoD-like phosphatase
MAYTVYLVGTGTPAAVQSPAVTVGTTVPAGDTMVLAASTGGSLDLNVWLVSDTQGNTWNIVQQSILGQGMWQFTCTVTTPLTTADTITVEFSTASDVKNVAVIGVHGAASTGTLLDQWAQSSGTSAAPSVTTPAALAGSADLAVAAFGSGSGGGSPTLPGGWTQAAQVHTSGSAWLTLAYQALSGTTAPTASATITSTTWAAQLAVLGAQGALPAAWRQAVGGAPTANEFQVVTKLAGATSVRLKVGTNLALTTGVQFVPAQVPDQYGYVRHTAAGLTPGTQYYYQAANTPGGGGETLLGPVGMCKTLPPAGSPQSFRVALVSCVIPQASDTSAIDDWVTWAADLNIYTGDQSYSDTQSTDFGTQVQVYEAQIALTGIGSAASAAAGFPSSYSMMHGRNWGYYCRSDHEAGPDNGDSGPASSVPWIPVNIAAAQQVYPFGTLGDTADSPVHGLYQAWVIGRIRFIMIDVRNTDRSPGANTDNASKTMLGATQLAWFYNQLVQPEPMKIVVGDTQWAGPASGLLDTEGPDKWWSYSTERSAIIAFIAANQAQVGQMCWMHGDSHLVGSMTPAANATWGGFPVYCAAPMNNTGGGLNEQVWSQFYDASSGNARQYGRITITDDGHTITLNFVGWDALNQVARVTQTDTFNCPPRAPAQAGAFPGLPA